MSFASRRIMLPCRMQEVPIVTVATVREDPKEWNLRDKKNRGLSS